MYSMKQVNVKTKTITISGSSVKLLDTKSARKLENAGWTINIVIK